MRDYQNNHNGTPPQRFYHQKKISAEIIYGLHPIMEALDAGQELERIVLRKGLSAEQLPNITRRAKERGIPVQYVPAEWFIRLGSRNHQGAIAFVAVIEYQNIEWILPKIYESGEEPLVVVAGGITDVRNLGAIVRTAECAGAHTLVVPSTGGAQINADAVKTSAGALAHFPVARTRSLKQTCEYLKASGLRLIAATEHGETYYQCANLAGPIALILGDEGTGVPEELLALCDEKVRIPLHGQISSLNVSVAAGILLYAIESQRHKQ